jgi:hypothetical protein
MIGNVEQALGLVVEGRVEGLSLEVIEPEPAGKEAEAAGNGQGRGGENRA